MESIGVASIERLLLAKVAASKAFPDKWKMSATVHICHISPHARFYTRQQ
jgi:hypothetical protein